MLKTIVLYGIGAGLLIAAMRAVEYRWLVVEHSLEIYGGIVAAVFASVGIWLGLKLTRERVVVREVPVHLRPRPWRGALDHGGGLRLLRADVADRLLQLHARQPRQVRRLRAREGTRRWGDGGAIKAQRQELAQFKEMYANPLINAAFTILEPLPVVS